MARKELRLDGVLILHLDLDTFSYGARNFLMLHVDRERKADSFQSIYNRCSLVPVTKTNDGITAADFFSSTRLRFDAAHREIP